MVSFNLKTNQLQELPINNFPEVVLSPMGSIYLTKNIYIL